MNSLVAYLENHPRRAAWIGAGILLLVGFAVWGRVLGRSWVVAPPDDLIWLSMVQGASPADIPSWFAHQPAFFYRPLARISLYLDYLVWRDNPFGFRLTHLVLCIAAAAALGWLVYEAARSRLAGFFAASLYLVYPGNWETTYWVSTRADVLAALFVLTSLALLLRARRRGCLGCWLGAVACAAAALFSKEVGLALPVIVAVWAIILTPGLRQSGAHWAWTGATLVIMLALIGGYWLLRAQATPMGAEHLSELRRLDLPLLKALRWGRSWWYRPLVLHARFIISGAVPGLATLLVNPAAFAAFWGTLAAWATALVVLFARAARPALMFFVFHGLAALPAVGEIARVPFRRFFYLPTAGDQALAGLGCWVLLVWCRARWPRWGSAAVALYPVLLGVFSWAAWREVAHLGPRLFGR